MHVEEVNSMKADLAELAESLKEEKKKTKRKVVKDSPLHNFQKKLGK